MKTGDEVVVVYAAVRRKDFDDVKFPPGSFVKAYAAGNIEEFVHTKKCGAMGQMVAIAMNTLAKKSCPEIKESPIIRGF